MTLPYMNTQNIRWLNRIIEINFELFADLNIKWFSDDYLHPEVDAEPNLLSFAEACINKERKRVIQLLLPLVTSSPQTDNNQGIFQTFCNEIQSLFYNRSKRTKNYLQTLEKLVTNRIIIDNL